MKRELAEKISDALNEEGIESEVYTDYSGRGMYGKTTDGIVADSISDILTAVINNAEMFVDEKAYGFRVDNMGMRVIIY